MPPKTPEQLAADWRRKQGQQPQGMQADVVPQRRLQQAQPITNNYMGPPEAQTQVEEPARAGPTGFVAFSQQYAANQDAANRMAGQAGQAALEGGGVGNLQSDAGRTALLQRAYGKAAQVTDMDAALAGAAGGDYFRQLESAYGPEAQARQAASRAEAQRKTAETQTRLARTEADRRRQAALNERRQWETVGVKNEAERLREADTSYGGDTHRVSHEQWAAMHGMTLEQWIRGGKKPAY